MADGPVEVFFSYAHEDEALVGELRKQLSLLRRQGVIREWHDRQIVAGTEWKEAIDAHLESAGIILLCVSADFLASDYCWGVELKRAMQRHEEGSVQVIPVVLRSCDWQGAPFGKLQGLPKDMKAVTAWADRDAAFTDVARGIRRAVAGSSAQPSAAPAPVDLAQFAPVADRPRVSAAAGGIAIGGSVSGSTIVTGSGNRVRRG